MALYVAVKESPAAPATLGVTEVVAARGLPEAADGFGEAVTEMLGPGVGMGV